MKRVSLQFAMFFLLLLSAAGQQGWLVVYTDQPATILNEEGLELGVSGKPFDPRLPADDSTPVTVVVRAQGYRDTRLSFTAGELRRIKRIPDQGTLDLEPEGGASAGLLALPVVLVAGVVIWIRRRKEKSDSPELEHDEQDYTVGRLLGKGATSTVYEGTSRLAEGRVVAIKILRPPSTGNEDMRGRFIRSLRSTMELEHPNLVKIYGTGLTSSGEPFLIMEKLEGESLKDLLARDPLPPAEKTAEILSSLCQVLQYLHSREIVHRDVKPENVFLTRSGRLKLMDLEISRGKDAEDLTVTGVAVGTPYYIAPEQARGEPTPMSDQYSVGVILFEMLTGHKPFRGKDAVEVITKHMQEPIPSLTEFNPEVTALQDGVVRRLMAKRPQNRFGDMEEAGKAIVEALTSGEGEQTGTVF